MSGRRPVRPIVVAGRSPDGRRWRRSSSSSDQHSDNSDSDGCHHEHQHTHEHPHDYSHGYSHGHSKIGAVAAAVSFTDHAGRSTSVDSDASAEPLDGPGDLVDYPGYGDVDRNGAHDQIVHAEGISGHPSPDDGGHHIHLGLAEPAKPAQTEDDRFRMHTADFSLWFEGLDRDRRRRVLASVLQKCDKDDDAFVSAVCERRGWVTTDIARVFERPVCIHILKFLDPRSVCRASRVSWAWHALAISDSVWKPHCLQMAWHLPYVPSQLERGAWKTYYTQCVQSWKSAAAAATKAYTKPAVKPQTQDEIEYGLALVVDASDDDNDGQAYGKLPVGHSILRRHDNDQEARRHLLLRQGEAFVAVDGRNSSGSRERGAIEQSQSSLTSNAYHALKELMKSRQLRWESDKARLPRSRSHVTMQGGADHTKLPPFMPHASGSSDRPHVAHVAQRRPGTAASPPVARGAAPAPALELEGDDLHPRIIFISSAMPARAVLLDAVRYDVVAIPYEAGATDLTALWARLARVLRGRKARSIAFACESTPGQLMLGSNDARITMKGLAGGNRDIIPEQARFWRKIASSMIGNTNGGRVDLFTSRLIDSPEGLDMIAILEHITELKISAPTKPVTSFQKTPWVRDNHSLKVGTTATRLYMDDSRLHRWCSVLDVEIEPIVRAVNASIASTMDHMQLSVAQHYLGEILNCVLFNQWGQKSMGLLTAVEEALHAMQKQDPDDPVGFVGKYLSQNRSSSEAASRSRDQDTAEGHSADDPDDDDLWRPIDQDGDNRIHRQVHAMKEISDFEGFIRREAAFVVSLEMIERYYTNPLQREIKKANKATNGSMVPPINTLSHRVIFTDASNLLSSHEKFLARLRGQGVGKDLDEVVATLVLELLTESNVHNEYLDNLEEALAELEKCAFKSQSFLTWLTHKRALHTNGGASLVELLQKPLLRLQFYRRYLVLANSRTLAAGKAASKEATASVVVRAFQTVDKLCRKLSEMQARATATTKLLPISLAELSCKEVDLSRFKRLVCSCKLVEVKPTNGDAPEGGDPQFVRVQDTIVLVFVESVVIFKIFEYWSVLHGTKRSQTVFLDEFRTQAIAAGPISDCLGVRHVVRLASSDHDDKAFYLSAPCKESQLEFFHGLRSALEMSLEKKGGAGGDEDGGGWGGGPRNAPITIQANLPPPPTDRIMRWWMT